MTRNEKDKNNIQQLMDGDGEGLVVYTDGSGFKGGIEAAAVIFEGEEELDAIRYKLGSEEEHEVYEAECVGLLLALHLAHQRRRVWRVTIWIDNSAAIDTVRMSATGPAHYLLDHFHSMLWDLRVKHPGVIVMVLWVPGHMGFRGNERADQEAKRAAQGHSSARTCMPAMLRRKLLTSQTATVRVFRAELGAQHV